MHHQPIFIYIIKPFHLYINDHTLFCLFVMASFKIVSFTVNEYGNKSDHIKPWGLNEVKYVPPKSHALFNVHELHLSLYEIWYINTSM